ncbi:transposase [Niallia sp. Krafla_26]|uniref:transposase n=1 Tax=Niallia sp. Krafla_26 TaxID=3064703 RepID=UPI003D17BE97
MPRVARVKSITGIYHLIWRGINRQEIFHDEEDWITFLEILQRYKKKLHFVVYAWCLMGNHVHLLIKEGGEDISITMKKIGVSYVGYYNRKYETNGPLFQGRYKSENVEEPGYLWRVIRYIHQNPVKAGMVVKPDDWQWNSCRGYYGEELYPQGLSDHQEILKQISKDISVARERFKEFNERTNDDQCMEHTDKPQRITDKEARQQIKPLIHPLEIAHIQSLPKEKRDETLRKVKKIEKITLRQISRILGIKLHIVFRA